MSEIKERRKFGEEGLRDLWNAKSSGITERYRKEWGLPGGSGGKEYFNRKLVISFHILTFVNVEL